MELLVTGTYILLMVAGSAWVAYKAVVFFRTQREREQELCERLTKEELAGFVNELKRQREKQQRDSSLQ